MKRRHLHILLSAVFVSALLNCKKPPSMTKADVIQERLDLRVDAWRQNMEKVCLKKVMEEAEVIVDSTMLVNAKLKRDTSDIPSIPGRPAKPDFVAPADSNEVKPIFERGDQ